MAGQIGNSETRPSLLIRIRDRSDQQAWELFVDTYWLLIYRYARSWGLDRQSAEDVVQEVFSRVANAIGGFEYDRGRGRFRDWLKTIAKHEVQRQLERQGRWPGQLGEGALQAVAGSDVDRSWDEEFMAQVLTKALERIEGEFSIEVWTAFKRTWLQDDRGGNEQGRETAAQRVADELGRSTGWVYKAKCQVLKRLKQEVQYLAEDSVLAVQ